MKQSLITALISPFWQGGTKRSRRLSLYLCASILLLAVVPAWGSPGRMVMVDVGKNKDGTAKGNLHQILRYSNNAFIYNRGKSIGWTFSVDFQAIFTGPCRTWIPTQGDIGTFSAEGIAVFNNKIFIAFTADTDCTNHAAGMSAYVAAFDLTSTPDYPDGHWIILDSQNKKVYKSLGKGTARTNNAAAGWGSGAAITVYNNMLYVITDAGVYTSGDGFGWSRYAYSFTFSASNPDDEPLDAVTIHTPDGPRILIVYGHIAAQHDYYNYLDAVDWIPTTYPPEAGYPTPTVPANPHVYPNIGPPSGHVRGRLSLMVGTKAQGSDSPGDTWAAGAKAPAVQLFAQTDEKFTTSNHNPARHAEYVFKAAGSLAGGAWGIWTWDSDPFKYFDHKNLSLIVYPYSASACSNTSPSHMLRQYIVVDGGFNWGLAKTPFPFVSDYLVPVPQNPSAKPTCASIPAAFDNATDAMSNYWTLVGVVLGSPPFSDQGLSTEANPDTTQLADLSGVSYDQTTSTATETKTEMENTASISAGKKITAGILDMLSKTKSFDATYKHAWEKESGSSSSVTVRVKEDAGTAAESKDLLGAYGWALFNAPHVYVHNWKVYAYDYTPGTGDGTPLRINPNDPDSITELQTLSLEGEPYSWWEPFELRNPTMEGGVKTKSYFEGMVSFNYTDVYDSPYQAVAGLAPGEALEYWQRPRNYLTNDFFDWQKDDRWEPRAGDGGPTKYVCRDTEKNCIINPLSSGVSKLTVGYTLKGDSIVGSGHTNEIEIQSGHSIGAEAHLEGFSVGGERDLTLGYHGKFSWNTKTTTGLETSVEMFQMTPSCQDSRCFKTLRVQPYWLPPVVEKAGNELGGVPWVPTAFKSQRPWCLTWKITCACHYGECCACTGATCPSVASGVSAAAGSSSGGISGTALPPANAFGRIVNGSGGGEGGEPYSHYFIRGGRMAWGTAEGEEQRIPMTADGFVPSKGVSIEVNGMSWSTSGTGSWKRQGDTWMFQTDPSAQPRVTLSLDFGSATYDLDVQKADLNGRVLAGIRNTGLALVVNDRYKFYTVLHHDVDITWRWSKPLTGIDRSKMQITSFQGRYNSGNQTGNMAIAGTLPAELPTFGDLEVNVNDHPYVAQLISLDGFQDAFETGGVVKYAKEGVIVVVDFGGKTWSATFNNKGFQQMLAPQWGNIRARLLVGGIPWLTQDHPIVDYSANLTLVH